MADLIGEQFLEQKPAPDDNAKKIEVPPSQEKLAEKPTAETVVTPAEEDAPVTVTARVPTSETIATPDEVSAKVEKILEDGLGEFYTQLPDSAKPLFKKKGEEAAIQITGMVKTLKVEVAKVLRLIREWLMTIPKVNKFFLEQEAKIKTDAIIEYAEARKEDLSKP